MSGLYVLAGSCPAQGCDMIALERQPANLQISLELLLKAAAFRFTGKVPSHLFGDMVIKNLGFAVCADVWFGDQCSVVRSTRIQAEDLDRDLPDLYLGFTD